LIRRKNGCSNAKAAGLKGLSLNSNAGRPDLTLPDFKAGVSAGLSSLEISTEENTHMCAHTTYTVTATQTAR
jgi:hypothetical protein